VYLIIEKHYSVLKNVCDAYNKDGYSVYTLSYKELYSQDMVPLIACVCGDRILCL